VDDHRLRHEIHTTFASTRGAPAPSQLAEWAKRVDHLQQLFDDAGLTSGFWQLM
jgi:hypothetical protein